MSNLFPFFYLMFILAACSDTNRDVNLQERLKKDTTASSQQILFAQPQLIDSFPVVIYPLILEKQGYGGGYGSSSGGAQRTGYWNLIFYNTETGSQNVLVRDKKILIYSIVFSSSSSSSSSSSAELWTNGINVFKENIIYTAVSKDYNANKQLDQEDPAYLFISSRDGTNFRQISPEGYNISSWEIVKGTTKIIMQAQKDNSGDKLFNEEDAVIPLIVDISSGQPAIETFNQNFTDSLKQRLITIWKN